MPHTASNLLVHFIKHQTTISSYQTRDRKRLARVLRRHHQANWRKGSHHQRPADHVHLLVRVPTTHSIADIARVIKANSSRWVHEDGCTKSGRNKPGWAGKRVMVLSALASPAQVPYKTTFCASASIIGTSHFKRSTWHFYTRTTSSWDERYLWD